HTPRCLVHTQLRPVYYTHRPPTEHHPLSLHDALPISSIAAMVSCGSSSQSRQSRAPRCATSRRSNSPACSSFHFCGSLRSMPAEDRKSTRLNSSHVEISYADFCLKKTKLE